MNNTGMPPAEAKTPLWQVRLWAALIGIVALICVSFSMPAWVVRRLGKPGEAVIGRARIYEGRRTGGCMISYSYQAEPGVAPQEAETVPDAACDYFREGQKAPITYLKVGTWYYSALELPRDLPAGPSRGGRRFRLFIAVYVIISLIKFVFARRGAAKPEEPHASAPPKKKASGPFLGPDS